MASVKTTVTCQFAFKDIDADPCENSVKWIAGIPFMKPMCHMHAMSVVVSWASAGEKVPAFILTAFPVKMKPRESILTIFVCSFGHVGRVIAIRLDDNKREIHAVRKTCNDCQQLSKFIYEQVNKEIFEDMCKYMDEGKLPPPPKGFGKEIA